MRIEQVFDYYVHGETKQIVGLIRVERGLRSISANSKSEQDRNGCHKLSEHGDNEDEWFFSQLFKCLDKESKA